MSDSPGRKRDKLLRGVEAAVSSAVDLGDRLFGFSQSPARDDTVVEREYPPGETPSTPVWEGIDAIHRPGTSERAKYLHEMLTSGELSAEEYQQIILMDAALLESEFDSMSPERSNRTGRERAMSAAEIFREQMRIQHEEAQETQRQSELKYSDEIAALTAQLEAMDSNAAPAAVTPAIFEDDDLGLMSPEVTPRSHQALCMAIRSGSDLTSPRSTRSTRGQRSRAGSRAAPPIVVAQTVLEEEDPVERRARERSERREREMARLAASGALKLPAMANPAATAARAADSMNQMTHRAAELSRLDAELASVAARNLEKPAAV